MWDFPRLQAMTPLSHTSSPVLKWTQRHLVTVTAWTWRTVRRLWPKPLPRSSPRRDGSILKYRLPWENSPCCRCRECKSLVDSWWIKRGQQTERLGLDAGRTYLGVRYAALQWTMGEYRGIPMLVGHRAAPTCPRAALAPWSPSLPTLVPPLQPDKPAQLLNV